MRFITSKASAIFTIAFILAAVLPATVRSDSDFIRLPSDDAETDVCGANFLTPDVCPVKCFRTDPVCGVDGLTYWCGCGEARCAGVAVKKLGFCAVGNGGSGLAGEALLLVHIIWLLLLGVFLLFELL